MANTQSTSQFAKIKVQGFDQLAAGLKDAIRDFQYSKPAKIAAILALLKPARDISIGALQSTTSYARRHPVRVMVTAAAIGLLVMRYMKTEKAETLH